jgi:GLPGLI family protein
MKTNLYLILLILSGIKAYSQNDSLYKVKVDYVMQLNFFGYTSYNAILHFNSTQSLFEYMETPIIDRDTENETEKINKKDDELSFNIKIRDTTDYYIRSDKVKNEIFEFAKGFKKNEFYYILEDMPSVEWAITDATKKINNHNCNQATCSFRGRNYTAWFTSEIQTSFGPLKLNGLPGLILELSDDTKEVVLHVKSISNENKPIDNDRSKYKIISHDDYKSMKNEFLKKLDDIGRIISSKMDRGFKAITTSKIRAIEMD